MNEDGLVYRFTKVSVSDKKMSNMLYAIFIRADEGGRRSVTHPHFLAREYDLLICSKIKAKNKKLID